MRIRLLLLLAVMAFPHGVDAATLKGYVKDLGLLDSSSPGIPGVTVTVKNAAGRQIASKLTDAEGSYQIENLPKSKLRVSYERLGYRERPTVYDVELGNQPKELEVLLIQESESPSYNENVAKVIQKRVDDEGSYVELITLDKLEPAQKNFVLRKLEGSKGTDWLRNAQANAGRKSPGNIA